MKLKENLVLRQVAGNWVVLPLGENATEFGGMLRLNDAGAILWQALEKDPSAEAMVAALTAEYDVSEQQVREDVEAFLEKLAVTGCLEQE